MMLLQSLRGAALAGLLLALAACTPSPIEYEGSWYSPEAERTGENSFQIDAQGNASNSQAQVEAYGLVKAAEVTQENGHSHFKIVDNELKKITQIWGGAPISAGYKLRLDIETYPESAVPEDAEGFFPAVTIIERLGPSVRAVQ